MCLVGVPLPQLVDLRRLWILSRSSPGARSISVYKVWGKRAEGERTTMKESEKSCSNLKLGSLIPFSLTSSIQSRRKSSQLCFLQPMCSRIAHEHTLNTLWSRMVPPFTAAGYLIYTHHLWDCPLALCIVPGLKCWVTWALLLPLTMAPATLACFSPVPAKLPPTGNSI